MLEYKLQTGAKKTVSEHQISRGEAQVWVGALLAGAWMEKTSLGGWFRQ